MTVRPCAEFVPPKPGMKYGAYCARCCFSRVAHERWDEWTEAAQITERIAAEGSSQAPDVPKEEA